MQICQGKDTERALVAFSQGQLSPLIGFFFLLSSLVLSSCCGFSVCLLSVSMSMFALISTFFSETNKTDTFTFLHSSHRELSTSIGQHSAAKSSMIMLWKVQFNSIHFSQSINFSLNITFSRLKDS